MDNKSHETPTFIVFPWPYFSRFVAPSEMPIFCSVSCVELWISDFIVASWPKLEGSKKWSAFQFVNFVPRFFSCTLCTTKGDAIPRPVLCRNALFYMVSEPALRANATEKWCKKARENDTCRETRHTEKDTFFWCAKTHEPIKNAHPRNATFSGVSTQRGHIINPYVATLSTHGCRNAATSLALQHR